MRRAAAGRAAGCAVALLVVAPGCSKKSPVEKPVPPDMSALVQSYEHPTLSLDSANIQTAFDLSVSVAGTVEAAVAMVPQLEATVHTALHADGDPHQIGSSGSSEKQLAVTGSGFMRVHRICPGPEGSANPDEANGSIDLTVGFTEQGIDPVVWGGLAACRFPLDGDTATLDGAIHLYVGENLSFEMFGTQPVLVDLSGMLTQVSGAENVAADFRVTTAGAFEYRVFVGDEHAIYWDDLSHRGFRAANGTWTCQFDSRLCTRNEDAQQLVW